MKTALSITLEKQELQEAMEREVSLLRNLLTSLHDEHVAILAENESMIEDVMEERLDLVSVFEQCSKTLITITRSLAEDVELSVSDDTILRHSEAIELLQKCLDPDDFELLSLRNQIQALMDEIYHQNDINGQLIKNQGSFLSANFPMPQKEIPKPAAKITLALLDR